MLSVSPISHMKIDNNKNTDRVLSAVPNKTETASVPQNRTWYQSPRLGRSLGSTNCVISHMCVDRKKREDDRKESIFEIVPEDGLMIEENITSYETFDDYISFMVLENCNRICYKDLGLFRNKFDKAINWFHKMKEGSDVSLPPKIAGLDVCLFDLYKFVTMSGGHDKITKEKGWGETAMSFGYPECYGENFKELFDQYLLIPQEHYEFVLERFGRIPSINEQDVGVTDKFFSGNVGSEGGVARSQDQEDQNIADTWRPDQIHFSKTFLQDILE